MARRSPGHAHGFSLIECLVATAILTSSAAVIAALLAVAANQMTAARHRSIAATLARSGLEQIIADVDAGADSIRGGEHLDAAGRTDDAPGLYYREWSVAPLAGVAGRLFVVSVRVTSNAPGVRGDGTHLMTLRRRVR